MPVALPLTIDETAPAALRTVCQNCEAMPCRVGAGRGGADYVSVSKVAATAIIPANAKLAIICIRGSSSFCASSSQ